jgi:AraC-like DNA-binding protein
MEPGETHSTSKVKEGVDFQVLIVSPECFLKAAEESGLPGEVHFRLQQVGAPGLLSAVQRLVAAIREGESPLEQQSRLACCIRGMLDYAERKPRESAGHLSSRALKLAVDFLREHYQDPVDLEDLSALTGLSRFVLVHAFTHQFGIPPHAYQIRIRIEQSRILLEGGVPPGQVAAEVGFSDQSHFHRHFKHILQVTPGEYVRSGHR